MALIRGQKQQFRRLQADRNAAHNQAAADELQALKEKRIKLEGKAKLAKLQAEERGRIQQSQQTLKDQSPGRRFGKNLAKFINKGKTQIQKATADSPGLQFGGSSFNSGGGFDAGGGSSPFSPKKEETKKKPITIRIER